MRWVPFNLSTRLIGKWVVALQLLTVFAVRADSPSVPNVVEFRPMPVTEFETVKAHLDIGMFQLGGTMKQICGADELELEAAPSSIASAASLLRSKVEHLFKNDLARINRNTPKGAVPLVINFVEYRDVYWFFTAGTRGFRGIAIRPGSKDIKCWIDW